MASQVQARRPDFVRVFLCCLPFANELIFTKGVEGSVSFMGQGQTKDGALILIRTGRKAGEDS